MTRVAIAVAFLLAAHLAHAQPTPTPLIQAGVDERIGSQIPLDTPFTDTRRGPTTLRAVLSPARPTLLVLAYARCTMLCSLVLRGVVEVAHAIEPVAGRDYNLVLISLDSHETLAEADSKHAALLAQLRRGDWSYLLGECASIDAVARALGFRYAWDPRTEQYAHPAVIFAVTPDGRVARYLHGVQFDPSEVDSALTDAAAGRLLSTPAAVVLRCFHYDPSLRRNARAIERYFAIGAALLAASTLLLLIRLIRRRQR